MMMRKNLMGAMGFAAVLLTVSVSASAATKDSTGGRLTFYKDVLPVLQESCQTCHRPSGANLGGMIAPMSFTSYQEVRPWAKSIARVVGTGYMPPWHASKEFNGVFRNERTLSEDKTQTLIRWANTGAAAGSPSDAPPPLEFPEVDWSIGTPDLVLAMSEPFLVGEDVEDLYVNFTVDVPLEEDRWVKSLEFRPGSEAVHHIIGHVSSGAGDALGRGRRGGMIGGIAPGNEPDRFEDGYGFLIKAGSKFVFAMHYHKESGPGTGILDQSQVGLKLYPRGEVPEQIHTEAIGNRMFEIPPGHSSWQVGAARVYERPIRILGLMPHMHLRGKAARYVAFYPDGRQETLLHVPDYDFNWQTSYEFLKPKVLPAGTRLEVTMWYENTPERASENNFNALRPVTWGGPTTDEMDLGWLTFVYEEEETPRNPSASGR